MKQAFIIFILGLSVSLSALAQPKIRVTCAPIQVQNLDLSIHQSLLLSEKGPIDTKDGSKFNHMLLVKDVDGSVKKENIKDLKVEILHATYVNDDTIEADEDTPQTYKKSVYALKLKLSSPSTVIDITISNNLTMKEVYEKQVYVLCYQIEYLDLKY